MRNFFEEVKNMNQVLVITEPIAGIRLLVIQIMQIISLEKEFINNRTIKSSEDTSNAFFNFFKIFKLNTETLGITPAHIVKSL